MDQRRTRRCLVTGATGYVGGRLVPELLAAGHGSASVARTPTKLDGRPWQREVEVVQGDATDADVMRDAMSGIDVAYYLLHSIGTGQDFAATERHTAEVFAQAAAESGVSRIVYLGGLDPAEEELSEHLASRAEVGRVLLESDVPTVALRAGVIIGSGSASFEMLRYLTERLPVMVTPRWVHSRIQPIAIRDVLRYLVGAAIVPEDVNRGFDIAGPDVLTYLEMMQRFAAVAGLTKRRILPVPVLTPSLSSHWVNFVTPVPRSLARPLVESLKQQRGRHRARHRDLHARPGRRPDRLRPGRRAGVDEGPEPRRPDHLVVGGHRKGLRASRCRATPTGPVARCTSTNGSARWRPTDSRCGGSSRASAVGAGWYSFSLGWRVRGWIDRLTGGPGLVRGRRDPDNLLPGDSLDWWRVEEVDEGQLLRLRAEMRLPGLAWLELSIVDSDPADDVTVFHQRAFFHPRGIAGHLYWWVDLAVPRNRVRQHATQHRARCRAARAQERSAD